jgi:hypothetical protein
VLKTLWLYVLTSKFITGLTQHLVILLSRQHPWSARARHLATGAGSAVFSLLSGGKFGVGLPFVGSADRRENRPRQIRLAYARDFLLDHIVRRCDNWYRSQV